MLSVRPRITELVFQLYGRPLHPELFEVCSEKKIERENYQATLQITTAGHVVCWQRDGLILTEVATSAQAPLPQKRRLMSHPLTGQRRDGLECRGGAKYSVEFQLESVDSAAFFTYQKEFALAGAREGQTNDGLLHNFDSSGRFDLGALSYVHFESRQRSLKIQALHTFPDDYAILKTQSVFKLPG